MLIKFEHRRRGNNISDFSNIEYGVVFNYYYTHAYYSFMMSGYDLCYVDTDKYDDKKCYVYYIRSFMEMYNKIEMRDLKIKKVLNDE